MLLKAADPFAENQIAIPVRFTYELTRQCLHCPTKFKNQGAFVNCKYFLFMFCVLMNMKKVR